MTQRPSEVTETQPLPPTGLAKTIWRSLRLRCPACGRGRIFRGPFRMLPTCTECGLLFDQGPGYFLGSIYVNYGLTALLVTIGYFAMFFGEVASAEVLLGIMVGFCVLFPLWFFRYARSLWIGFDYYIDPPTKERGAKNLTVKQR